MRFIFNNPLIKQRRKELRSSQTDVERKLWSKLRSKQMNGIKFFRQYSVDPYILDFYCPKAKLAVELDGSHHMDTEQKTYDQIRTAYLMEHGIRVIRFWDNEVMTNMQGVLEKINNTITPSDSPLV